METLSPPCLFNLVLKPGMSADMCTGLIKNVISHYCFNVFKCFLDAQRHLIKSVTFSYLASLRKISHQLLLDWFSPGFGDQNGIEFVQKISQFLIELDKVIFYITNAFFHCFYWRITDQISCWFLLVTLFCLSPWVCRWHYSFGSLCLSFKRMMLNTCCQFANDCNTYYLIKHYLFNSPYLAPHLAHLLHWFLCLLANLSSWLIEPVI